jgi:peroxiredoxin
MKIIVSVVVIIAALAGLPHLAHAENTVTVYAPSGRFSLDIPANWIVGEKPNWLGSERLYGNSLVVADSQDTLADWSEWNTSGALIFVEVLALDSTNLYMNNDGSAFNPDGRTDAELLEHYNQGIVGENQFEHLEFAGYPAVRITPDYGYTFNAPTEEVIVLADRLIYVISYTGPDLDAMFSIAQTLRIYPDDSEQTPIPLQVQDLSVPLESGWISQAWSFGLELASEIEDPFASASYHYLIFPGDHEDLLPILYSRDLFSDTPDLEPDLPAPLLMVAAYPYDLLFGDASIPTDDTLREQALNQIVETDLRGKIEGDVQWTQYNELPTIDVTLTNVFGGANQGHLRLVDANRFIYALLAVGPESDSFVSDWMDSATFDLPEVVSNEGAQIGLTAPDFTLSTVPGEEISLSDYREQIVLLNFCNVWLFPCADELTLFQQLEDVSVLWVSHLDTPAEVETFAAEHNISFPMLLDEDGSITDLFRVQNFPTSFIIDPEGVITMIPTGVAVVPSELERWIATAQ